MNKKVYMKPELTLHRIQLENMLALSIVEGNATTNDVLTKESNDWDIWGDEE